MNKNTKGVHSNTAMNSLFAGSVDNSRTDEDVWQTMFLPVIDN